ncbi:MAG: hypothetical protein JEZ09_10780 [Salinivirgaceae bacterium]|nr:hypothetical protein [Salinivirgaceae bacterium]
MKKIIFIILSLVLFISCNKDETVTTIIKGTVSDYYTSESVRLGTVSVYSLSPYPRNQATNAFEIWGWPIESTSIKPDGSFSFETDGIREFDQPILGVYNDSMITVDTIKLVGGQTNTINFKTKSFKKLKITISDTSHICSEFHISLNKDMIEWPQGIPYYTKSANPYVHYLVLKNTEDTIVFFNVIEDFNYEVEGVGYFEHDQIVYMNDNFILEHKKTSELEIKF